MNPRRFFSAALLFGLVAIVASGQVPPPPPGTVGQTTPKDGAKEDMAKDKSKEKPPEWPKEIGGRGPDAYVKDLTDPDPHVRNIAFQTLPKFGPDARKTYSKAVVKSLEREMKTPPPGGADTTVITAGINCIGALGVEESDVKDACRLLGLVITEQTPHRSLYRQYAIPALCSFGPKAENGVTILSASDVIQDRSYEVRRLAAHGLFEVGQDESRGPTQRALEVLTVTSIKDVSAAVRTEAFQTLVLLGPPVKPPTPPLGGAKPPPPVINKEMAARYIGPIKAQLAREKDQQVEAWARLAVMRFDPDKEINDKSLTELAQIIAKGNSMAKFHALNAIALLGDRAEKQLNTIVLALQNSDPIVVDAAVKALLAQPYNAKQVLPEMKARLEARPEEYFKELLKVATKIIEEARPPGSTESPPDPKTPPPDPTAPPKK